VNFICLDGICGKFWKLFKQQTKIFSSKDECSKDCRAFCYYLLR
jgi:hypothetical protein